MSVQWFVLRGDQSDGPLTSSELKLLADQRQITPDTLVKQGESGPWVPAGTIEGLFVEYHGAKPAPSTGSPPPVRYMKPREPKRPVLAVPPTLAQTGAELEEAGQGVAPAEAARGRHVPEAPAPVGVEPTSPSAPPEVAQPSPITQPLGHEPALSAPSVSAPSVPTTPEDLVSPIWYLRTPDGQQYGPISKQQLDQWVAEGRVGEDCWLWRAGWADWQGASQVYGGLGQPLAHASPAVPAGPAAPASAVAPTSHPTSASPAAPASAAAPTSHPTSASPAAAAPAKAGEYPQSAPSSIRPTGVSVQTARGIVESPAVLGDPQRWIGQTLGHYQLVQFIGRGPSGWVYRGRHVALDRLVGVRLIPTGGEARLFEQLSQGLRAAVHLSHPHLVEVYDLGDVGGMVYVAMELMEGGSLADWIRRSGRIPAPAAVGIFHQVALALEAVHGAGLLHRDIKPSNILFTSQGVAKLSDLGLAALTEARLRAGPTALGSTAYYLAPELFQGQPATVRSDLYSLGATFYHALCGHAPGEGIAVEELVRRGGQTPVQPIAALVPGLTPSMAAMIDRLLLKDPSFRFSSVKEVLEMFEKIRGAMAGAGTSLKGPATPTASAPARAAIGGSLPTDTAAEPAEGWWTKIPAALRSFSWKQWLIIGGGLLAAIVLGLLVVWLLLRLSEPPSSELDTPPSSSVQTSAAPLLCHSCGSRNSGFPMPAPFCVIPAQAGIQE